MNAAERDELLIRLEERSRNSWRVLEKLEKHQVAQNSSIETALIRTAKNSIWITVFKWGIGTGLLGGAGWLTNLQGLW